MGVAAIATVPPAAAADLLNALSVEPLATGALFVVVTAAVVVWAGLEILVVASRFDAVVVGVELPPVALMATTIITPATTAPPNPTSAARLSLLVIG